MRNGHTSGLSVSVVVGNVGEALLGAIGVRFFKKDKPLFEALRVDRFLTWCPLANSGKLILWMPEG